MSIFNSNHHFENISELQKHLESLSTKKKSIRGSDTEKLREEKIIRSLEREESQTKVRKAKLSLTQSKWAFNIAITLMVMSYFFIILIITSQIFPGLFPQCIYPETLETEKLYLFVIAFLTQVLLLPRIIYGNLFSK